MAGLEIPGGLVAIGHRIFEMATGVQKLVAIFATDILCIKNIFRLFFNTCIYLANL